MDSPLLEVRSINKQTLESTNTVSVQFENATELLNHYYDGGKQRAALLTRDKDYFDDKPPPGIGSGGRGQWASLNEWFGPSNGSGKEVLDHAITGDQKLYKVLGKYLKQLEGVPEGDHVNIVRKQKRKLEYTDFGDELDIHAVYQGRAESAWRRMKRVEIKQDVHLVTIFINIGGSAHVKVKDSLWRTAVALKTVDELQKAGKSVRVLVGGQTRGAFERDPNGVDKLLTTSIVVKEYNQPLTAERLAAMCNLAFYRTFGFYAKTVAGYKIGYGGGYSGTMKAEDLRHIHIRSEVEKGHTKYVLINSANSHGEALNELEKVKKQLVDFN